jgi:anaerobic ribonucleoside-triphosphate reductase activating protein
LNIRINKAHFPVTVLGYGRRIGIWLQGCPIRCAGCVSADTWEDDPEREMPLELLMEWCHDTSHGDLDGITVTGGEPFHQPEALRLLLEELRHWRQELCSPLDIICYSGFELEYLELKFPALLTLIDAVIPGPFLENLLNDNHLCGSNNQRVVILTSLGKERYGEKAAKGASGKQMQASSDSEGIWLVGIPERGDIEEFRMRCAGKGLNMEEVSWDR